MKKFNWDMILDFCCCKWPTWNISLKENLDNFFLCKHSFVFVIVMDTILIFFGCQNFNSYFKLFYNRKYISLSSSSIRCDSWSSFYLSTFISLVDKIPMEIHYTSNVVVVDDENWKSKFLFVNKKNLGFFPLKQT